MSIKLKGSSDGSVSFDAPADTSPSGSDITLVLPTTVGSAEQFLKNSGTAGTLEFSSMVETSTGVGIGTSSPSHKLSIDSTSDADLFRIRSTAITNNTNLRFGISGSVGEIHASGGSSGTLAFKTYGSERMRIDTSGNVGVGTSSPAQQDGNNNPVVHLYHATSPVEFRAQRGNGCDAFFTARSAELQLGTNTNHRIEFRTNDTERMRIDNAGRLLVGTTAASGSGVGKIVSRNDVDYSSTEFEDNATLCLQNETNSNPAVLLFHSNDSGGSSGRSAIVGGNVEGVNSQLGFYGNASNLTTSTDPDVLIDSSGRVGINNTSPGSQTFNDLVIGDGSANDAGLTIHTSTSGSGSIGFSDGTSGSARFDGYLQYDHFNQSFKIYTNGGNERLRINSSGRVGIGQSSPNALLEINSGTAGNEVQRIEGAYSANGSVILTNWRRAGGAVAATFKYNDPTTSMSFGTDTSHSLMLRTGDTDRLTIDSSGRFNVGETTVPNTEAHRFRNQGTNGNDGALRVDNTSTVADHCVASFATGTNSTATSNVLIKFGINNYNSGSGRINANGTGAAAFGSFSDERLKENIVDLPSQWDNIKNLRPVEFDFIESEGGEHQIGFIAQEFETVYADAVASAPMFVGANEESEEERLMITGWSKTEARLVKALQEAIAKIETLETKVAALEAQ